MMEILLGEVVDSDGERQGRVEMSLEDDDGGVLTINLRANYQDEETFPTRNHVIPLKDLEAAIAVLRPATSEDPR